MIEDTWMLSFHGNYIFIFIPTFSIFEIMQKN